VHNVPALGVGGKLAKEVTGHVAADAVRVVTGTRPSRHFVAGGRRLVRQRLECGKCVRERAQPALLPL
jgi:hypothetical protein